MNLPSFDEGQRRRLLSVGALTTDCDGDEILIGLTVAESIFLAELHCFPVESIGLAESRLFLYLSRLHSAAFSEKCKRNR